MKRARPRTKVRPPPRELVKAAPELVAGLTQLAEVYERLCSGEVIEAGDRALLQMIVSDILGEADPRERFFETLPGAPGCAWHHVFIAQDVHLQEDFATAPKRAIGRVALAWRLSAETVRGIERRYRTVRAGAGIRNIVDQQRKRWVERKEPKPPM